MSVPQVMMRRVTEWLSLRPADLAARTAYAEVFELSEWSAWFSFEDGRRGAPKMPGVYLLREPHDGTIRYVGMAGERAGGGRPQGLHGRLAVYWTGKGAVSGFGEAALDRALADPDWVQAQLENLRAHGPRRAKEWAGAAVARLGLEASWSVCADAGDARYLEGLVLTRLREFGLWNR